MGKIDVTMLSTSFVLLICLASAEEVHAGPPWSGPVADSDAFSRHSSFLWQCGDVGIHMRSAIGVACGLRLREESARRGGSPRPLADAAGARLLSRLPHGERRRLGGDDPIALNQCRGVVCDRRPSTHYRTSRRTRPSWRHRSSIYRQPPARRAASRSSSFDDPMS